MRKPREIMRKNIPAPVVHTLDPKRSPAAAVLQQPSWLEENDTVARLF